MVPLVHFTRLGVGRKGDGRSLVVRSALIAPGARVSAFGVCHGSVYLFGFSFSNGLLFVQPTGY